MDLRIRIIYRKEREVGISLCTSLPLRVSFVKIR
jgi:hypothetical protein